MQAVDSSNDNSVCGVTIEESSWSSGQQYAVSIKGTEDEKDDPADSSQTREVSLMVVKYVNGVQQCKVKFGTAQVN